MRLVILVCFFAIAVAHPEGTKTVTSTPCPNAHTRKGFFSLNTHTKEFLGDVDPVPGNMLPIALRSTPAYELYGTTGELEDYPCIMNGFVPHHGIVGIGLSGFKHY